MCSRFVSSFANPPLNQAVWLSTSATATMHSLSSSRCVHGAKISKSSFLPPTARDTLPVARHGCSQSAPSGASHGGKAPALHVLNCRCCCCIQQAVCVLCLAIDDALQEWKKAAGAMIQGESPLPAAAHLLQPLLHPLHSQLASASLTSTPRFITELLLRFVS